MKLFVLFEIQEVVTLTKRINILRLFMIGRKGEMCWGEGVRIPRGRKHNHGNKPWHLHL